MSYRLFILAGEPSGDAHGAKLAEALRRKDPSLEILGWGGDKMREAGVHVLKHISELAFMGFVEVVRNLPKILRNFKDCEKQIREFKPHMVVFIDYPGFNLRMTPKVRAMGIPVVYYIAPQTWAWKESRVRILSQHVQRLFVILPFEEAYFRKHGVATEFVGHPLLEALDPPTNTETGVPPTIVALVPGSRKQEVQKILPKMVEAARSFPDVSFVISQVNWLPDMYYSGYASANVSLHKGSLGSLLSNAKAAIVTSGTATLETAIYRVPQMVVYHANSISVFIARNLIRVKFISLVNLILDRQAIPELIQTDLTTDRMQRELRMLLSEEGRSSILNAYDELIKRFEVDQAGGMKLSASDRVANGVLKILKESEISDG